MNEAPAQPNNDMLRFLIREAVEREIVNRVGPLNSSIQIVSGKADQLNRDYGAVQRQIEELSNIVKGNPTLNLVGLAQQILETRKAISSLEVKLDVWQDRIEGYTNQIKGARWVLGALALVGVFSAFPQLVVVLRAIGLIP
jgi:hypothetical protein